MKHTKGKVILRRKNEDTEGSKYQYFVACANGVEIVAQCKSVATVINEGEELMVVNRDWKVIKFRQKK